MSNFYNSMKSNDCEQTYFCNYGNRLIRLLADRIGKRADDSLKLTKRAFAFVRDKIIFGGDLWQTRASETVKKGYGACWNKNLLLIALLRYHQIPARLNANPMKNDFMKPAMGIAYLTVSSPFYHCFTEVYLDGRWLAIDPTLDRNTYDTFFVPKNVDWGIDWNGSSNMRLYTESIVGPVKSYPDIDRALTFNLNSHFLFKYEPGFILNAWLKLGNNKMWRRCGNNAYVGGKNSSVFSGNSDIQKIS